MRDFSDEGHSKKLTILIQVLKPAVFSSIAIFILNILFYEKINWLFVMLPVIIVCSFPIVVIILYLIIAIIVLLFKRKKEKK